MADDRRRRATRRGRSRGDPFLSLPRDEDWIAALRDDEGGREWGAGEPEAGAAVLYDHAAPDTAGPDPVDWPALRAELDDQRAVILALADKVDALEAALDQAVRRPPPEEAESPVRPAAPTVREVVTALRSQALDAGARLAREVAARRPARPGHRPPA